MEAAESAGRPGGTDGKRVTQRTGGPRQRARRRASRSTGRPDLRHYTTIAVMPMPLRCASLEKDGDGRISRGSRV